MRVDYVRVYQRTDHVRFGCDPPEFPTKDYISAFRPSALRFFQLGLRPLMVLPRELDRNLKMYMDPNVTVLADMGQVRD